MAQLLDLSPDSRPMCQSLRGSVSTSAGPATVRRGRRSGARAAPRAAPTRAPLRRRRRQRPHPTARTLLIGQLVSLIRAFSQSRVELFLPARQPRGPTAGQAGLPGSTATSCALTSLLRSILNGGPGPALGGWGRSEGVQHIPLPDGETASPCP